MLVSLCNIHSDWKTYKYCSKYIHTKIFNNRWIRARRGMSVAYGRELRLSEVFPKGVVFMLSIGGAPGEKQVLGLCTQRGRESRRE